MVHPAANCSIPSSVFTVLGASSPPRADEIPKPKEKKNPRTLEQSGEGEKPR